MKKLIFLYFIVLSFGMDFGTWKNSTWHFPLWGYNSSKYVSLWLISGFFIVTAYGGFLLWRRIVEDDKERVRDTGSLI